MDIPTRWAAAALVAGAFAVGGCGGEKTVDDAQVEQGIEQDLSTPSAKVTKASCPDDVAVQKGDTFTCNVTMSNDATGKVTVTQEGAGRYTYAFKSGSVEIPGSSVEASLEKELASGGAPNAAVTCPANIIVKVGTTVTCNVSSGSGAANGKVTYTFSSLDGTVDPSSVEAS